MLPRPEHREQIVRIARAVPLLREPQDVVDRRKPHLGVLVLAIEVLRVHPAGVHACKRNQPFHGRRVVPAVVERGIGRQRRLQPLEKHEVMRRRLRRAADRRDGAHHVGKEHPPLERLLRAHRESGDELDALNAQVLGQQTMLRDDVVVDRDVRKGRAIDRRRRVAGRRRQPVAEHVGDDDEVARGIDGAAGREHQLAVGVMAGVEGRDEDDVVARGVQ